MLSIIITALNEDSFILDKTIQSIIDSAPGVEIIVIDDCSDIPIVIKQKNIILERNKFRIGVAQSRHIGATLAKNKWLLFTDSHMLFEKYWYNNFIQYSKNANEKTVFCGCCLGLWEDFDLSKYRGKYYGAKLELWNEKENQILEGKWVPEIKDQEVYDISCLMGALYFIRKEYFFQIRGLSDLKMWGSDEPCLSLKIWLSGGEIKMAKNIKAGHLFRSAAPYTTGVKYLVYNKIRMAKTLLPDELGRDLISRLPKTLEFFEACKMINQEYKIIEEYANYYKSIFTKDIYWFLNKFNINI